MIRTVLLTYRIRNVGEKGFGGGVRSHKTWCLSLQEKKGSDGKHIYAANESCQEKTLLIRRPD